MALLTDENRVRLSEILGTCPDDTWGRDDNEQAQIRREMGLGPGCNIEVFCETPTAKKNFAFARPEQGRVTARVLIASNTEFADVNLETCQEHDCEVTRDEARVPGEADARVSGHCGVVHIYWLTAVTAEDFWRKLGTLHAPAEMRLLTLLFTRDFFEHIDADAPSTTS